VLGPSARCRGPLRSRGQRPAFLLSQCFVTLSAVVPCRDRPRSVPLVTGLCRSSGNAGKLALAKGLLRAVGALGPVCLLLDAWYMRGSLIRTALRLGHEVIGQVRRDTALFALPPPRESGRRGRLYGARLNADAVAALPASVHAIAGYGGRSARLRHAVCRPRFLKGVIVRAVWCELEKGSGWARARLLLSTDPTLSAPAIVEAYSRRWSIEPLFRDLKMIDGLGAMWQRGRTALLRWLHLVQIARTLLVLLTARAEPQTLALIRLGGWRPAATLTPGLVKDALAARFRNFEAFRLLPETCRKSGPVRSTGPPANAAAA
jgi:hypothetical protein